MLAPLAKLSPHFQNRGAAHENGYCSVANVAVALSGHAHCLCRACVCSVMPVMLICELPVPAASDDDVIDAVSVVASPCERPRNILLPVDLRRRRKRRRKPTSEKPTSHDPSPPSSSSSGPDSKVEYVVEFAVCVPPLYGNISTVDLVEFIEVNR